MASMKLRTESSRRLMMQARFVRQRASRVLSKSVGRKNSKPARIVRVVEL
jgi:hypothetical protein